MASDRDSSAAPGRLLAVLNAFEGGLAALEKRVAALSLCAILIGVGLSVVTRVVRLPLPSTNELAIVAMAPLTFVGAAFASYMHQHITIDIIDAIANGPIRRIAAMLASLAMCVFAGTYGWLAFALLQYAWSSGERLIDLGIPVWVPVGTIVAGSLLMLVHSALDIVRLVLGLPRTADIE